MTSDYWSDVHRAVADDLAAVNYPGFPPVFNRFVDRIFARSFERAVCDLEPGRACEIGCGRGRWLSRLRSRGWSATGVDIAEGARPPIVSRADILPLRSRSFDLVIAVTVLQHIEEKDAVLAEMLRITRPGGRWIVVEVLDRPGVAWQSHMFPKTKEWWEKKFSSLKLDVEKSLAVEHLPLLRLAERLRSGGAPGAGPPRQTLIKTAFAYASMVLEFPARFLFSSSHRLWRLR